MIQIKNTTQKVLTIDQQASDKILVERCRAGSEQAFRQLVEQYEPQIRSTVRGMLGNAPEAEEVAQDVFIRFYRAMDQFQGNAQLSTYLQRIAINLSLNELKRRKKWVQRWLPWETKKNTLHVQDRQSNPERFEQRGIIDSALQQLEPNDRAVVVLRLVEGYSVKETSEMLDMPMGTVGTKLARAQKQLREILAKARD